MPSFTYVRVPADERQPTEELSASTEVLGDALPDILKPHFAGGSIKNADGLRAECVRARRRFSPPAWPCHNVQR